jgi:hypothetical protein
MHLRPPSAPLDAFFTPVRRRHPDVDIVLGPAPEPAPPAQPVDEAHLAATLDRVTGVARRLSTVVVPTEQPPSAQWGFGPAEGTVTACARSATTTRDGFGALVALRGVLEAGGWRVRRLPGTVERLSGARDGLGLRASYAEGTGVLLLEVRSEPSHVGKAQARSLVRQ